MSTALHLTTAQGTCADPTRVFVVEDSRLIRERLVGLIGEIEGDSSVHLGAIGLGYPVDEYYSCSAQAVEPEQLLDSLSELVALMLAPKGPIESARSD